MQYEEVVTKVEADLAAKGHSVWHFGRIMTIALVRRKDGTVTVGAAYLQLPQVTLERPEWARRGKPDFDVEYTPGDTWSPVVGAIKATGYARAATAPTVDVTRVATLLAECTQTESPDLREPSWTVSQRASGKRTNEQKASELLVWIRRLDDAKGYQDDIRAALRLCHA